VFYPGIAAVTTGLLSGLLEDPALRANQGALVDAAERHHCYELQIGLTHLRWSMRTWSPEHVTATTALLAEILERGPGPRPAPEQTTADG
jgi:hypothetical protein